MTGTESIQIRNAAARDAIFASIRKSLAESSPYDKAHQDHHRGVGSSSSTTAANSFSRDELVETFRENLASVGASCIVVDNEAAASKQISSLLNEKDVKKVAVSNSELVKRIVSGPHEFELIENASKEELFKCDLGITAAQWAIAETGTLVLESNAERHRLVSLVPPIHVCLLKADAIRQTMGEVLELTSRDLSRVITFITGASRTSDIELTLAIGVHGPGELFVIVIND